MQSRGCDPTSNSDCAMPADAAAWITVIDPDNKSKAPKGGGRGFGTADATNGTIGLTVSGNNVSIVRPNFSQLNEASTTIDVTKI